MGIIAGGQIIEGSKPFEDQTASFTIGGARVARVTAATAVTATLPAAADNKDREFTVIRLAASAANVTVTDGGSLTDTLTGPGDEELSAYSNGSAWVWR